LQYKKDNVFTRNTRSIREKSGENSRRPRQKEEQESKEIKKTGSFSSGSRVEGRVKSFQEQERSEVVLARGPGTNYREHRTLSADDKDDIQKVKGFSNFICLLPDFVLIQA
jgi:hypothetical protein